MNSSSSHARFRTYENLFLHLGKVTEGPSGKLTLTRNGQTLALPLAAEKEAGAVDQLTKLRHFLQQTEPSGTP